MSSAVAPSDVLRTEPLIDRRFWLCVLCVSGLVWFGLVWFDLASFDSGAIEKFDNKYTINKAR